MVDASLIGLSGPSQAEIAQHLDLSDRSVRELLAEWGIDHGQLTLTEFRLRYIRKLREAAAGRATVGDIGLATERARLAREQADKIAMQNAISRRELGPVSLMQEVLAKAGSRAGKLLDTIPGEIRRREPGISAETLTIVAGIVAQARNSVAALTMSELGIDAEEDDEDEVDAA